MEAKEFCDRITDGADHSKHPSYAVVVPLFRGRRFKGETGE
jgi:hypothetical protein